MDETAKREGQVTVWLERLDKTVQELGETINQLEGRLDTVLGPDHSPAVAKDNKENPEEALVFVADSIREQVKRLQCQQAELNRIIGQIEL